MSQSIPEGYNLLPANLRMAIDKDDADEAARLIKQGLVEITPAIVSHLVYSVYGPEITQKTMFEVAKSLKNQWLIKKSDEEFWEEWGDDFLPQELLIHSKDEFWIDPCLKVIDKKMSDKHQNHAQNFLVAFEDLLTKSVYDQEYFLKILSNKKTQHLIRGQKISILELMKRACIEGNLSGLKDLFDQFGAVFIKPTHLTSCIELCIDANKVKIMEFLLEKNKVMGGVNYKYLFSTAGRIVNDRNDQAWGKFLNHARKNAAKEHLNKQSLKNILTPLGRERKNDPEWIGELDQILLKFDQNDMVLAYEDLCEEKKWRGAGVLLRVLDDEKIPSVIPPELADLPKAIHRKIHQEIEPFQISAKNQTIKKM